MRPSRHAHAPRPGVSPPILALAVIVVVIAAAAVLYFTGVDRRPAPAVDAGESPAKPPAERVNPFEGLPPEQHDG